MSKRMIQSAVIVVIVIVIGFVIYDFISQSSKQKEADKIIAEEEQMLDENGIVLKYGSNKGNMVYDYELIDLDTGEIVKISDFRGKKVFLNFWASWCPPCRAEAPHLQKFSEENDDVVILGVNVKDAEQTEGAELEFVEEFGLTFPNTYAPDEMLNGAFYIESFPTSFFINSKGIIEEAVVGAVTQEIMESRFERID